MTPWADAPALENLIFLRALFRLQFRQCPVRRGVIRTCACIDAIMFNANFLFASLVWGSIGIGFLIYGRKQGSWVCLMVGVLMITASYFASTATIMTIICIALILLAYYLLRQGY
jgi:hypothetical protein